MSAETGKLFRKRNPWYESWRCAWRRCNDRNHKSYGRYGGRGILFLLTKEQASYLWDRDSALTLERPRLDRRDVNGPYCLENCRFIEDAHNIALAQGRDCTEWED